MTRGGIFERRRASDFDSQTIARAVAVANVGGAAEKVRTNEAVAVAKSEAR